MHTENHTIFVGITLGIFFLIVGLLFILMMRQKRRMNEYFRKNGGSVLQKVENIKIFTKDELKKITKNNSEVLGQGGFGKVYKGILEDNTLVAVKASIEVNDARKEDFTNEVIMQSQMIHTNIIKLLGCCLEVDVPMLVMSLLQMEIYKTFSMVTTTVESHSHLTCAWTLQLKLQKG